MNLRQRLTAAAGWLIMAALVYAPWALGCRPFWAVEGLATITFAAGGLWFLGWLARPTFSVRWHLVCVAALLILGWDMVLNAHGLYLSSGDILPVASGWPSGPGAVDGSVCREMMVQISAVLIALLVAGDLASQRLWRWRFMGAMASTVVALSGYGLLQKAGVVVALVHSVSDEAFATYDYHGNAGALLNLGIPALFALAVRLKGYRAGWVALLLCMGAAMATISRAAMAITLLVMIALIVASSGRLTPLLRRRLVIGLIFAAALATAASGAAAWERWRTMTPGVTLRNPRFLMLRATIPMAKDAGFFGYGPGSFKLIYFNSPYLPPELYPRWRVAPYEVGSIVSIDSFAHNDYLQFTIEWGWLGAALWAILICGAIVSGVIAYRQCTGSDDRLLLAAAMIAVGGVLIHALMDWPLQLASLQLYAAIYLAMMLSSPCESC